MSEIEFDENAEGSELIKQFRKMLKAKDDELKTLRDEVEPLKKRDRQRTVGEVLKGLGASDKIARFVPGDLDATEEAIKSWVIENADVFNIKLDVGNSGDDDDKTTKPNSALGDVVKIGEAGSPAQTDLAASIASATSAEGVLALLRAAGAPL